MQVSDSHLYDLQAVSLLSFRVQDPAVGERVGTEAAAAR